MTGYMAITYRLTRKQGCLTAGPTEYIPRLGREEEEGILPFSVWHYVYELLTSCSWYLGVLSALVGG